MSNYCTSAGYVGARSQGARTRPNPADFGTFVLDRWQGWAALRDFRGIDRPRVFYCPKVSTACRSPNRGDDLLKGQQARWQVAFLVCSFVCLFVFHPLPKQIDRMYILFVFLVCETHHFFGLRDLVATQPFYSLMNGKKNHPNVNWPHRPRPKREENKPDVFIQLSNLTKTSTWPLGLEPQDQWDHRTASNPLWFDPIKKTIHITCTSFQPRGHVVQLLTLQDKLDSRAGCALARHRGRDMGTFPMGSFPSLVYATPGIVSIKSIHWVALFPSMKPQNGFGDLGNVI